MTPHPPAHRPALPSRPTPMSPRTRLSLGLLVAAVWAPLPAAQAQTPSTAGEVKTAPGAPKPSNPRKGKLLLTGGVSSVEGAAGGGITPWAVIGTQSTGSSMGASAYLSRIKTKNYAMSSYGAAVGFGERAELSIARQDFDTKATGTALGLPGLRLKQNILGVKFRVAGDAILESDRWMPQIAVGLQYKELNAGDLAGTLTALGAKRRGTDVYLSATKLLLGEGLLINGTLRATKANQGGLLGFGGTARNSYRLMPEVSVAYLLRHDLAIGVEYRWKPDNLNPSLLGAGLREEDWKDVFVAWMPTKNFSLTAAYVDLGVIVPAVAPKRQTGGYVSAQVAY